MSNLSQKDKHSPVVQTGQPNLEQTVPPQTAPTQHIQNPLKKEVHNLKPEEQKKTGTK
ncbi:MAG TPA: hypothetical protein VK716_17935 [Terracidiphilus sp.]|jgi:hypothetical protein|nr:hypothetical protein [Terracidiphilus sp.]